MTIKSKAFKFLLGIAVVFGVALAFSASAYDFGAATLRVGSRGADVMEVQRVVGANPVDGIFGPMTMAAVKAWQANNGLEADGVVGNYTKAAMNAVSGVVAPSSGCQAGWIVNPFTNQPCGTTTPTTPSTPSTTLKGEEAELEFSVDVQDDIDENGKDQHAFTIEIEADKKGGDAKIERLDILFNTTGAVAYRSIKKVALEVDGDVIAEVDTDSRSDWRGSNDTLRFSNLDLVVKSGDVVEVEVMLDVTDKATAIELDEISYRYVDAAGVVVTDDETSIGASVDVKTPDSISFRITENKSNPSDTSLDVSSSRSNETLAIVDVEVRKGEGTLEEVEVEITFTGGTVDDDTIAALLSRVTLKVDGDVVDYISSSSFPGESGDKLTLTFDADEFDMEDGDKFQIEVLANTRANDDGDITSMQVSDIELIGYDEGGENSFNGSSSTSVASGKKDTTSFAPVYTITQGDIDVIISKVDVKETDDRAGKIEFEIEVTNETGSTLGADLYDAAEWVFDVTKYGTTSSITITDIDGSADENATIANGDVAKYKVSIGYDSVGSLASFSIEVKKIGGKSVGYLWK